MQYDFRSSFEKSFKRLSPQRQKKVKEAIQDFLDFLDKKISLKRGLGLKNLQGDYWEFRSGIKDRIIIEGLGSGEIIFWLVGNHDEIRRFIKSRR